MTTASADAVRDSRDVIPGTARLKPRRLGAAFLVLSILMLLAAINYGNNLVYLISFLLFSLLVNSGWQTRRQLRHLVVNVESPPPHHAGQTGQVILTLQAPHDCPGLQLTLGNHSRTLALQADQPTSIELDLPELPRGHHRLPAIALQTDYPLGLWTIRRSDQPLAWAWVYPRPAGDRPLPQPASAGQQSGDPTRGEDELDDLRRYVPGDPLSRLAFKHYARTGELVTKRFSGQHGDQGDVVLDFDQIDDSAEERLSQLTRWILQLAADDRRFSLRLPDRQIDAGRGRVHRQQALEALAVCQPPGIDTGRRRS